MYDSIIPALFAFTLLVALAYGIVQWFLARKAKREHHRSAASVAHPDRSDNQPTSPSQAGR